MKYFLVKCGYSGGGHFTSGNFFICLTLDELLLFKKKLANKVFGYTQTDGYNAAYGDISVISEKEIKKLTYDEIKDTINDSTDDDFNNVIYDIQHKKRIVIDYEIKNNEFVINDFIKKITEIKNDFYEIEMNYKQNFFGYNGIKFQKYNDKIWCELICDSKACAPTVTIVETNDINELFDKITKSFYAD
jgi:hypothetical protein